MPVYDITRQARDSDAFRRVVHTAPHTQVVLMTIPVGGDIGMETHPDNDQVLVLVDGEAETDLDGTTSTASAGQMVVVPAGVEHNVRNTGSGALRLWTIYGPPDHADGTVHLTRAEADEDEHDEPPATGGA